ncbi:hypothetical protein [Methanobrevibacter millerae]|uniref:Uncharacterized protein n=1 Tax=Methanobrevibacter millerae TaxID=230361 RepID=A0A1G5WID9_9EURY|nr:hypothetical protein [Methanobrevibacter millerae]SDA57406.1 hypothetical protein SAMN02910315_01409 [Methanobrevibacter millerae]
MALFRKKTPEEKKLKELTGGSNFSPEFTMLLGENNLVLINPSKDTFAAGYNIRELLKRKIKNKEISIDEIEPELNLMIKKAKYIIEHFELINFCPKCGKKLSKHNIFICDCGNNLLDEYEFPKLNNEEIQRRKRLINIVNNNKINLKTYYYPLNYAELIINSKNSDRLPFETESDKLRFEFNYPNYYTKLEGKDNILCILIRKLSDNEEIKMEIKIEDNPIRKCGIKYILEKNESPLKVEEWDINNIYLKEETSNNIVHKLYHFYLGKNIIFSYSIPLHKSSDYIESKLLYDLKIMSKSIQINYI